MDVRQKNTNGNLVRELHKRHKVFTATFMHTVKNVSDLCYLMAEILPYKRRKNPHNINEPVNKWVS